MEIEKIIKKCKNEAELLKSIELVDKYADCGMISTARQVELYGKIHRQYSKVFDYKNAAKELQKSIQEKRAAIQKNIDADVQRLRNAQERFSRMSIVLDEYKSRVERLEKSGNENAKIFRETYDQHLRLHKESIDTIHRLEASVIERQRELNG